MIDRTRLETILMQLAQHYAQEILPPNWHNPGDYPGDLAQFAARLADFNVMVMCGLVPDNAGGDSPLTVQTWVQTYVRLYELLTRTLFPSFMEIKAFYADREDPPVVVITGAATPIIKVIATYITPYVAVRQRTRGISDYELRGLLDGLLDELAADDLSREEYQRLRDNAINEVRALLGSVVRQQQLVAPRAGLFERLGLAASESSTQPMLPFDEADDADVHLPFDDDTTDMPPEATPVDPMSPVDPGGLPFTDDEATVVRYHSEDTDTMPVPPVTAPPDVLPEEPPPGSTPRPTRLPEADNPPPDSRRPAQPRPLVEPPSTAHDEIPIFFAPSDSADRDGAGRRKPPVLDLPDNDDPA